MVTSARRRQAAEDAIQRVLKGARARDVEDDLVDFKLEDGRLAAGRRIVELGANPERAASALARHAACFANTTSGGVLIVGIDDASAGHSALVGACSDAAWLRTRIWALTQPGLTVDIDQFTVDGVRLLLIDVADALAEVHVDGRLRTRVGTECVELTGDRARHFLEARRGFDWSAQPSGLRLSAAVPNAVESAAGHYSRKHGVGALGARELATRLKLLVDDDQDPEMNNAGAVLLCRFEPGRDQVDLLVTLAEGAASFDRIHGPAPVLPLYDTIVQALLARVFPARTMIIEGENQAVGRLPELSMRESLVNAIMHRDYRTDASPIIALAIGEPAETFKVRSPGGFPPGVVRWRLLSTQSRPRNPALAEAMRVLGLAEREGVGIDSIYRVMLRDGHPEPEIVEQDGEVIVRLQGGPVDLRVRAFLDAMARRVPSLGQDVRATIAIDQLSRQRVLRPAQLAAASQSTLDDASRTLDALVSAGGVERLLDGSRSYRLTTDAVARLEHRLAYSGYASLDEQMERVDALLDIVPDVSRADLVARLGMSGATASRTLRAMVRAGRLESTTKVIRRGPGMRYRRPS